MKSIPVVTVGAAILLVISRWLPLESFGLVGADNSPFVFRAVLSVIVLVAALFVVLSRKYESATANWAFGAIGMVLGYWLAS